MAVFDFLKDKTVKQPTPVQEPEPERTLLELPTGSIRPNPNQPRKTFHDEALEELAESIKQVGVIQPLVVRSMEDGYELVAGERRLRACKLLGLETVPCLVQREVYEEESAMMALIENLQRENLHYLEEAECYAALLEQYGLTQEELAQRVGKSQSAIANKLRVLRLSPQVKQAMTQARMTERHARTLLRIREEEVQLSIIEKVKQKGLSVKDTEKLVEKTLDKQYDDKTPGAAPRPKMLRYLRDFRLFINTLNTAVKMLEEAGMQVEMQQQELPDGIDVTIRVRKGRESS